MSPVVKKKGEKFTLPSKYLLFILTIVCTALIILTFYTGFRSLECSRRLSCNAPAGGDQQGRKLAEHKIRGACADPVPFKRE